MKRVAALLASILRGERRKSDLELVAAVRALNMSMVL